MANGLPAVFRRSELTAGDLRPYPNPSGGMDLGNDDRRQPFAARDLSIGDATKTSTRGRKHNGVDRFFQVPTGTSPTSTPLSFSEDTFNVDSRDTRENYRHFGLPGSSLGLANEPPQSKN